MEEILLKLDEEATYATDQLQKYEDGEDPREYHWWGGYLKGIQKARKLIKGD